VGDELEDFALIKRGIVREVELELLVRAYFQHYHPALVSVPTWLMSRPGAGGGWWRMGRGGRGRVEGVAKMEVEGEGG